MRRTTILWLLVALMLAVPTVAAGVSAPVIKVTRVEPPLEPYRPGDATTVQLRDPREELVLFDPKGQPWLRINNAGVFERDEKGSFREVRKEPFFYLHEGHIDRHVLVRAALPYPWRISGTYGGRPFVMEGTYTPPGGGGRTNSESGASGLVVGSLLLAVPVALAAGGIWLVRRYRRARQRTQ